MSTTYDWNTNYIYTEELTSDNMNASQVGFMLPGVYNADFYFSTSTSEKCLYFNIKAGSTFVFSHKKDVNLDIEYDSYSSVTKCVCARDTRYAIVESNKDYKAAVLDAKIIYVCLLKKVIPSKATTEADKNTTDAMPSLCLISFDSYHRRNEICVPDGFDSTLNIDGGEKSYYLILGVLFNVDKENNTYLENTNKLIFMDWIKNHCFTTRCLPAYNHFTSINNLSKPCELAYWVSSNKMVYDLYYDNIVIDDIIFSKKSNWKSIYSWLDYSGNNTASYSLPTTEYKLPDIESEGESDKNVYVDFIYAKTNIEQVGSKDISNIFTQNYSNIVLDKYSFTIDADIATSNVNNTTLYNILHHKNSSDDLLENTVLYSDTSIHNIERLLSIIKNRNVLPTLYNKIRFVNRGIGNDTIIPIALSFRLSNKNVNSRGITSYYVSDIDPNNTLCFSDIQLGNYNINNNVSSFKIADVLSALPDDEETY